MVRPRRSIRDYEGSGDFRTKNGYPWPSFDVEHAKELEEIVDVERPFAVWIDEPALFAEETVSSLPPWLFEAVTKIRAKTMILISGISATSEMEIFGKSFPLLLAIADEIIPCKGDCRWCGRFNVATRTVYLGEDEKTSQDLVGGAEIYQPACPECWNKLSRIKPGERARAAIQ